MGVGRLIETVKRMEGAESRRRRCHHDLDGPFYYSIDSQPDHRGDADGGIDRRDQDG